MLEIAGGRNVFGDTKQQAVQASTEMLLTSKAEVIVELRYGDSLKNADIARSSGPGMRWRRFSRFARIAWPRLTGDEFVVPGPRVVEATLARTGDSSGRDAMKPWCRGRAARTARGWSYHAAPARRC